ncbi:hypothetical protein [Myceligenerans xiligouense]|uniref:Uncharacterized protein n=1 Tax=Myceligenerans xiligouense TaxID=253184 RepID=A0A3N4YNI3_9MICO|nr:hypothetical protein [Myceligenerans xiligouense]RPF21687.1 hypothetical protein EDD34_2319 [Myceligenerans xiligouense]
MIIRTAGTVLLGTGFVALATAAFLRDPTALDANIGAGVLTLVGTPLGALGLAMTIGAALFEAWRRGRRGPDRAERAIRDEV